MFTTNKTSLKLKNSALVLALAVFAAASLYAEPQAPEDELELGLEESVAMAIEGNLSLKQSQITLSAAERAKKYSWNSVSPSVSAGVSFSDYLDTGKTTSTLSASASISLTPSIYTTIKKAVIAYNQQQLTYDEAVRTVELNVRKAYYGILKDQENINLYTSNLESSKKQYEANLAKYESGSLPRLDVLSAQVSYQNAQVTLQEACNTWESDMADFRQTLGLEINQRVRLTGSLDSVLEIGEISLDGIEQKSAKLKDYEYQMETAKATLLATRFSAWGPKVTAAYSYTANLDPASFDAPGSISLNVTIPIDGYLPWSSGAQSIASQKDTIKSLEYDIKTAERTYDLNVQNYLTEIKQAEELIELRKANVEVAQQTYEMTENAYSRGTKDILSLQTASDNLNQAKVNLMTQAYSLITIILDLENTIGVPFGTLGK